MPKENFTYRRSPVACSACPLLYLDKPGTTYALIIEAPSSPIKGYVLVFGAFESTDTEPKTIRFRQYL